MKSLNSIHSYLKKRGVLGPWILRPPINRMFNQAIVIPAYSEFDFLPRALESINNNKPELLNQTLVVVVINNTKTSPQSVKENNRLTLQKINNNNYLFTHTLIDAASSGFELPSKHAGVGLARKIGMDLVLPHLISPKSLIFCTDADVEVSRDYLSKVTKYFDFHNSSAAVIGFNHLQSGDPIINDDISKYENFLKTTAKKMKNAGSPYGYVSMGSTIVCTVKAYCAVGGMSRKKATEDFYFLQELTKYCGVENILEPLVFPSPRPISRVHLGTGYQMEQMKNGFNIRSLYYSDDAYRYLSKWLQLGSNAWNNSLNDLLIDIKSIHPHIIDFLKIEGIETIWSKIQDNAPSELHFKEQFHRWFDGLKTIRFLKRFSL